MEYIVVILGILLLAVSVAGTVLPGLPGPTLAFGSLVLVWFNPYARANIAEDKYLFIIALLVITALVFMWSRRQGDKKVEGTQNRVPRSANLQVVNIMLIAAYFIYVLV